MNGFGRERFISTKALRRQAGALHRASQTEALVTHSTSKMARAGGRGS
jgi:hypothetical protein